MAACIRPSATEARTNATFAALLWALSRPGEVRELPATGLEVVAECLCDREIGLFCTDEALLAELRPLGARLAPLAQADYIFIPGGLDAAQTAALARAKTGTLLHPETAAVVVAPARLGEGTHLALSGPGVPGRREIRIGAVDDAFWAARQAACRYPLGWDLFLLDGARAIGLPRSTRIEVL